MQCLNKSCQKHLTKLFVYFIVHPHKPEKHINWEKLSCFLELKHCSIDYSKKSRAKRNHQN